jgi:hypothetical protein
VSTVSWPVGILFLFKKKEIIKKCNKNGLKKTIRKGKIQENIIIATGPGDKSRDGWLANIDINMVQKKMRIPL